jgi:hypothetical protein
VEITNKEKAKIADTWIDAFSAQKIGKWERPADGVVVEAFEIYKYILNDVAMYEELKKLMVK